MTVTVTDGVVVDASDTFDWTVSNTNQEPPSTRTCLTRPTPRATSSPASTPAPPTPTATPLTYAATGLPDGLSINTSSGLISGTLSSTSAGLHHVTVTVTDGVVVDASDTFDWTVSNANQDPTFDQDVPDQTNAEGDVITGLDAGATDPDGDTLTYAATGLPDGLSINTTSGLISGTLSSTSAGRYHVTVTVTRRRRGRRHRHLRLDGQQHQPGPASTRTCPTRPMPRATSSPASMPAPPTPTATR